MEKASSCWPPFPSPTAFYRSVVNFCLPRSTGLLFLLQISCTALQCRLKLTWSLCKWNQMRNAAAFRLRSLRDRSPQPPSQKRTIKMWGNTMIGERKIADPRIPTPENTRFSPFFSHKWTSYLNYISVNTEKIIRLLMFDYVCIPAAE